MPVQHTVMITHTNLVHFVHSLRAVRLISVLQQAVTVVRLFFWFGNIKPQKGKSAGSNWRAKLVESSSGVPN